MWRGYSIWMLGCPNLGPPNCCVLFVNESWLTQEEELSSTKSQLHEEFRDGDMKSTRAYIYIYTRKKSTIIHMQTAHSEMVWRGGWSNETPTEIEGTATTIGGQLPSVQISGCWVVDQLPTFTPYYLLYFLHFKNTSGSWIYEMRYGYTYPPFLQVQSQQDAAQLDESKALGERS